MLCPHALPSHCTHSCGSTDPKETPQHTGFTPREWLGIQHSLGFTEERCSSRQNYMHVHESKGTSTLQQTYPRLYPWYKSVGNYLAVCKILCRGLMEETLLPMAGIPRHTQQSSPALPEAMQRDPSNEAWGVLTVSKSHIQYWFSSLALANAASTRKNYRNYCSALICLLPASLALPVQRESSTPIIYLVYYLFCTKKQTL